MSKKPDRKKAKRAVQFKVSSDAYDSISIFLTGDVGIFKSLSNFVETLIFCARDTYIALQTNDFVNGLRRIKALFYIASCEIESSKPKKLLHLTIDVDALDFLDIFLKKYRSSFRSRNELVELFFMYSASYSDSADRMKYILGRMKQAQLNNPIRV